MTESVSSILNGYILNYFYKLPDGDNVGQLRDAHGFTVVVDHANGDALVTADLHIFCKPGDFTGDPAVVYLPGITVAANQGEVSPGECFQNTF